MPDEHTLELARALHRTIKQLQNRMVRQHGPFCLKSDDFSAEMTFTQLSTLTVIRDHGEMSLKELAEAMHVSAPSASTMVDKLVDMKALNREHSKVDRREVRVSLAPLGTRAVEELEQIMLESLTELLEAIGPDYAEQWGQVYRRIEQYLHESSENESTPSDSILGVK